jgi:hypothetical protein
MKTKFWALMLLSIQIVQCSPKAFDTGKSREPYITFGQGGGFSGLRMEYVLRKNGQMLQKDPKTSEYVLLHTADRSFAKQAFQNFFHLGLDSLDCYEPGDLYYFIEHHDPDTVYRVVWGKPGFRQQPIIIDYFNTLYRTAKSDQQ